MKPQLAVALIVWTTLGLAGCDRDIPILDDYKLYDTDGSNQAIIGAKGMVAVTDVTAFAVKNSIIFVEFGGNYQRQNCSYKRIDTSKQSMIDLANGTLARREAITAIKAQKQGVMSRSCAIPV
ncbi:MAG: hypothetical protein K2P79_05110 [Sphingomonas sp.]|nr:hypothetical protein [Sphingomonas sp.]